MPIYEYECKTCGVEFEVIQKFKDAPLKRHDCSPKSRVLRKVSLNAFQLKGGGWYNEGYSKGKEDSAPAQGEKAAQNDKGGDKGESAKAGSAEKSGDSAKAGSAEKSKGSAKAGSAEKSGGSAKAGSAA